MEQLTNSSMESPKDRVGRKPFGEITNSLAIRAKNEETPVKDPSETRNEEEALTPLANLKMLIRVASQTEPELPSRRELFREESAAPDHDYLPTTDSLILTPTTLTHNTIMQENVTPSPSSTSSSLAPPKVSRKQKSLGLLCEKFMCRFPEAVPEGEKCEIPLDDLAKQMSTERRRIYDIVNVLEAVQMMTKVGKNLYQWHGITYRIPTLAWLRQLAIKLKMLERYNEVKLCEEAAENVYGGNGYLSTSPTNGSGTPNGISPFSPSLSPGSSSSGPSPSPIERKTSLGLACQKFLMLFLIAPEDNAKINLDFAARVIHGIELPESVMKTRIRRLYDIANILQSLQLIQKVQITENNGMKKPAFQYIGPNVNAMDEVPQDVLQALPATRQRHSLLAVGKNLLNIPDEEPPVTVASVPPPTTAPNPPPVVVGNAGYAEETKLIMKPLKKRWVDGFHFDNNVENNSKIVRAKSSDSIPAEKTSSTDVVNDENKKQHGGGVKRTASLLDLSDACEFERQRIRRQCLTHSPKNTVRIQSPASPQGGCGPLRIISNNVARQVTLPQQPTIRSHIIHPSSSAQSQAVTILRKQNPPQPFVLKKSLSMLPPAAHHVKVVSLQQTQPRLFGFNRNKTVIAVVPSTNNGSPPNSYNSIMDLSKKTLMGRSMQ